MNIDQARQSYRNDASFHQAVDAMRAWIHNANVTPAEVRAAAMLACIMYEEVTIRQRQYLDFERAEADARVERPHQQEEK